MVSHRLELHGHAQLVHALQAAHITLEGIGGAWLDVLAVEGALGPLGTVAHEFLKGLGIVAVHVEHLVHDVLVQVVIATLVTQRRVQVVNFAVFLPIRVPILGDGHADEHHPSQRGNGIEIELACAVGQVGLSHGDPLGLHVGALGHAFVNGAALRQVTVQVFEQCSGKILHL